jgi:hypothetical protein
MTLREVAIFSTQRLLLQTSKDEVFIACVPYLCPAYALPMHAGLPTIFMVGLPTVFLVGNDVPYLLLNAPSTDNRLPITFYKKNLTSFTQSRIFVK